MQCPYGLAYCVLMFLYILNRVCHSCPKYALNQSVYFICFVEHNEEKQFTPVVLNRINSCGALKETSEANQ